MSDKHVHDESILIRTAGGQRAAFDEIELDEHRRRLLRLVNGFTSLGSLKARLDPGHDWHSTARALLDQRLVALESRREASVS